jgi:hypothetical protein
MASKRVPVIGERVMVEKFVGVYIITHVSFGGDEVSVCLGDTNFEMFRIPVAKLTYLENVEPLPKRKPPQKASSAKIPAKASSGRRPR